MSKINQFKNENSIDKEDMPESSKANQLDRFSSSNLLECYRIDSINKKNIAKN